MTTWTTSLLPPSAMEFPARPGLTGRNVRLYDESFRDFGLDYVEIRPNQWEVRQFHCRFFCCTVCGTFVGGSRLIPDCCCADDGRRPLVVGWLGLPDVVRDSITGDWFPGETREKRVTWRNWWRFS